MARFKKAGLYLVTSQVLSRSRTTLDILRSALDAGVGLVQLREKKLPIPKFFRLAEQARRLTDEHNALLIINDRLDIALACNADGVHLGQDDLPIAAARGIAEHLILGASTHNKQEAIAAQQAGASYVNIGPLFPTNTKQWTSNFIGLDGIREIAPCVSIPFTVMGGIKLAHVPELLGAGARTLAVVTAITAADDPCLETGKFLAAIMRGRG